MIHQYGMLWYNHNIILWSSHQPWLISIPKALLIGRDFYDIHSWLAITDHRLDSGDFKINLASKLF